MPSSAPLACQSSSNRKRVLENEEAFLQWALHNANELKGWRIPEGGNFGSIISRIPSAVLSGACLALWKRGEPVTARKVKGEWKVDWVPLLGLLGMFHEPDRKRGEPVKLKRVQSVKSRLRCGEAFGDADTRWVAMVTLTVHHFWPNTNTPIIHLVDFLRRSYGRFDYGWMLEFQDRGAPHWHLFIGEGGGVWDELRYEPVVERFRKGKDREVICGRVADEIAWKWIELVGDDSPEFVDFQLGGIVERMAHPDGAARYVQKEASKAVQKEANASFELAAWWRLSNHIRCDLEDYEFQVVLGKESDGAHRRVWDDSLIVADGLGLY